MSAIAFYKATSFLDNLGEKSNPDIVIKMFGDAEGVYVSMTFADPVFTNSARRSWEEMVSR